MTVPPLGLQAFGIDPIGASFGALFAMVWGISGVYALLTITAGRRLRFWAYYLSAAVGGIAVAFAQDAITFYFAFALMALSSWGLVAHFLSRESLRAGRIYLTVTVVSEMPLLAALMIMVADAGSGDLAQMRQSLVGGGNTNLVMALVLGSVALKIGSLGVSGILPLTYTYTPAGAVVALAGASVKVGALAMLRLLPFGTGALDAWGAGCIVLGLATTFVAAVLGVLTTHPKAVLGYSSASQMGLLLTAAGAGLAGDAAAATGAVVAYSIHHGLAKASLFLGEDLVNASTGWVRTAAAAALALPALALVGAPFMSGFVAKYALYDALYQVAGPAGRYSRTLMPWAALGTAALMARFASLSLRRPQGPDVGLQASHSYAARWSVFACSLLLVAGATWLWPAEWVESAAEHALDPASLWTAVWPVLVVAAASVLVTALRRSPLPGVVVPGDWMLRIDGLLKTFERKPVTRLPRPAPPPPRLAWLSASEEVLTSWLVAGSVFMLLAVALVLLASRG